MKKLTIIIVITIICLPLLAFLVIFTARFYAFKTMHSTSIPDEAGFSYYYFDGLSKYASVVGCLYDPGSGQEEIDIPAMYTKYHVTSLGGHFGGGGSPFNISIKGLRTVSNVSLSEGSFDWYLQKHKRLEVVTLDLTLNVGPNIKEIFADQPGIETAGKLYLVRVYVNCDPVNSSFYSENGILYHKNGEVVEGFLYWNQDYVGSDKQ